MVLGPIDGAATGFALQLSVNAVRDRRKRRRDTDAYQTAADATIQRCEIEGHPARSDVWNSVTTLLATTTRARQIASWYATGTIDTAEFQDMIGDDPIIGQFLEYFISLLDRQRADALPLDLQVVTDIIGTRFTQISRQITEATHEIVETFQREPLNISRLPSVSYWLGLPPSLAENFVGREADLEALAEDFKNHRSVVISGGDGAGKSRLAAEYASRIEATGFWTTAGPNAEQTLSALASSLGVPMGEGRDAETASEVQRSLSELGPETLWVVDNVQDLDLVNELSSVVGPVRLLVTTRDARNSLLPPTFAFRHIDVLDPDSAIALLGSRRRPGSRQVSSDPPFGEIAELVGRLPLALEMLAVRLGAPRQTPEGILEQLKTAATPIELEAFQDVAGATIPRVEGVYSTIVGTLAELTPEARNQISPLGYADDVPIPDPLLGALTGLEGAQMDELVVDCSGRSILSLVDNQVVVHSLTIAAIAATNEKATPATTLLRVDEYMAINSETGYPTMPLEIAHYQKILQRTSKILGASSADVLSFANSLAICCRESGRFKESARLDERTLGIKESLLGPEHPYTLISRNNLANAYRALGRYEEAVKLDEDTLSIRQRVLGPEHLDVLSSSNNLATGYRCLGRYVDAAQMDEQALSIRKRVQGVEHPDTLSNRTNLASGYRDLGLVEEAVRLDEETLGIMERVLGMEHLNTLTNRSNLAIDYHSLGRHDEAVRLDVESLRVRERLLGSEHLESLSSRNNLANGYHLLGQYEEATRLFEETLIAREGILGPEHPDTLQSRNNLAIAYQSLGRSNEAVQLWNETVSIRERLLGPDHPDTLTTRSNLAGGYRDLGWYEEAVRIDEQTLSALERVLGTEHPDVLTSRNNLAIGYGSLGRYDEALWIYEENLNLRGRVLGPEHPDTLQSRNNLANGYRALRRYEEAILLDEETVNIRRRVLGLEHPDTIRSRKNLEVGYRALGRDKDADELESSPQ